MPIVRCRVTSVACVTDAGDNDTLVVVEVEPSDPVHSNQHDEVFLRVADENRRLTFGQRQELIYDKGQAAYETSPVIDSSMHDLDTDLLGPTPTQHATPTRTGCYRRAACSRATTSSRSGPSYSSPATRNAGFPKPAYASFATAAMLAAPAPVSNSLLIAASTGRSRSNSTRRGAGH